MVKLVRRLILCCALSAFARPIDAASHPIPLLRFPTASRSEIAFVAQGDLWTVPRGGGRATRLTNDPGQVLAPHFSPDGRSIAFTWRRAGSNDVYVLPVGGGDPRQLTHGPSSTAYDNLVTGWTPDGKDILFLSIRASPFKRYDTYQVAVSGGLATSLDLGHSGLSSLSPDGTRIAYDWSFRNLGGDRWKRYRGGQAGELFAYDFVRHTVERLTDWEGTDTAPMWAGDRIYFLSDRGPEHRLNIWAMGPSGRTSRQITQYTDFDIDMPSIGPGGIAFQVGGKLCLMDLPSEQVRDVPVIFPEGKDDRPREVSAVSFVRHQDIVGQPDYAIGSNDAAYVAIRGDLFAVPGRGAATDLTATPGYAEDYPVISPDGRTLAFVTDAEGEQQVATMPLGRPGHTHILTHFTSGVLYAPRWSPDGRWLAVADANKRLWLVDANGGHTNQIAFDPWAEIQGASFSADSHRLAYSVTRPNQTRAIHLRDMQSGRDVVLSAPMESDRDPVFSADGRTLFFISARREHPFVSDRDREGTIATLGSNGIYRAILPTDIGKDATVFAASVREVPVNLAGDPSALQMRDHTLFYLEEPLSGIKSELPGQHGGLHGWDVSGGRDRLIASGAESYVLSPDGQHALIVRGSNFHIVDAAEGGHDDKALSIAGVHVAVSPQGERHEMFEQTWRLDRDLFWDRSMHGLDWRAVHDRYAPLVARARSSEDMIYLLGELQGELSTSHMFVDEADSGDPRPIVDNVLIGADFTLDAPTGRYRLAHIYRGDASRSRFRAPLGDPSLGVTDGDFLLAVNGEQLLAPDDPYRLLSGARLPLTLTIAHDVNGPARTISVDPIRNEAEVRKLDWIASNRATVDRLSHGRIGYLYLSDFDELGSEDFLRQYYAQTDKSGLVIDVRYNRGGFTSQWMLDLLRRPQAGIFRNREGGTTTLPGAIAPAHLVTLTNIFSSSDGDQFPYFFRAWNMGPVVGQRTWGGVRGIKGPWQLIDGTDVTVPKDSLFTPAGAPLIENRGADPDVPVDDAPAASTGGRDLQLERAVAAISATPQN